MTSILLVGPLLPSGGVSRYVQDLLGWHGKHDISLFNIARPPKERVKPGVGYREILNAGLWRLLVGVFVTLGHMVQFPFVLMSRRPTIVHICGMRHWPFWENAYYIIVSRLAGAKVTLHFLSSLDLYYADCGPFQQSLIRVVLRRPQRVILLSERVAAFARSLIPPERTLVIPSSVDLEQFAQDGDEPITIHSPPRVLFIGGVDPFRKGVYDLLEAAVDVIKVWPDVRFILTGGASLVDVEARWRQLGLERHIECIGSFPEEAKAAVLQSADILVLPSYNEGLPYVVIEAMAAGLPVIATTVGGIPEAVTDGENGYIVDPGDKRSLADRIIRLLRQPEVRRRMGSNNRLRVMAQFSKHAALTTLDGLFDDVASSRA